MSNPALASQRLRTAVLASARQAGVSAEIDDARWTPWASVTFSGARHEIKLILSRGAKANAWLADLPEHEFRLSGHLVADLTVSEGCERNGGIAVTIEALTVEA